MDYEFHTTLPIQRRGSETVETLWVETVLTWEPFAAAPRITAFHCDDEELMQFWDTPASSVLEAAIISDALKLHTADKVGDTETQGWKLQ